jgi:hypothetical protein
MTRYSSTMTEALQEIREGFSPKQIKMAIGIAADPRYKGGNYSGAYKQIEKIKKGLADHPQVAAVLKRLNTDFDPEMVEDWEDVSENSFDLTELAMPRRDFDKLKKGDKVTITYDSSIKKGHVTTFEVKGRSKSAKYKVDKITMQPEGAPSGRMKYYLYSRDGGDATLAMGDMGASMTKIKMEGLKEAAHALAEKLKVSDGVGAWIKDFQKSDAPQFQGKSEEDRKKMALAAFADAGGKLEETELDETKSATGYEIFHKDFSSAMQHATAFAKSKGQPIKKDEIDNKVATGPKKPSKGKENSYNLETEKGKRWSVQVYNMGNKFELNMYLTSSHVPEGDMLDEAVNYKFAAVDKKGLVIGFSSDERDAKDMARRNKGRVVTLTKPLAPKKGDMMVNRPLPDKMDKFPTNTSATQGKRMGEEDEKKPDMRPDSAKEVEQGRDDKKKTRIAQLQLQIAKAQETINKLNAQEKPNG